MPQRAAVDRDPGFYRKSLETMPRRKRTDYFSRKLRGIAQYAYRHAPATRNKFDAAGRNAPLVFNFADKIIELLYFVYLLWGWQDQAFQSGINSGADICPARAPVHSDEKLRESPVQIADTVLDSFSRLLLIFRRHGVLQVENKYVR